MTGVYTMKKVVSLLLALAMCLSVTSFAWADGITTKAELESAIDSAENGATITLAGNIDLTAKLVIPENKTFTLDLNGHNITQTADGVNAINLSAGDNVTITGTGIITGNNNGIYVPSGATLTITGGTIKAVAYNGIYNRGTVTVNDGMITGENHGVYNGDSWETEDETGKPTGSIVKYKGTLTINGGSFSSIYTDRDSGSVATLSNADGVYNGFVSATTVTGGTFNGQLILTGENPSVSGAAINKGFSWWSSTVPAVSNVTFGENAAITSNNNGKDIGDYQINAARNGIELKAFVTFKLVPPTVGGKYSVTSLKHNGASKASGGIDNYLYTNAKTVVGDKYTVKATVKADDGYKFDGWYLNDAKMTEGVDENGTLDVILTVTEDTALTAKFVSLELDKKAQEKFTDYENTKEYAISSVEDMDLFAYAVTNLGYDFSGKTVRLTADLDFEHLTYRVVGDETRPFKGTFDAKKTETENYTISNITTTTGGKFIGLFGNLDGATIQYLTLKDSKFDNGGVGYAGGIAAEANSSTITNCTVSNVTTSGWFSGAVIGHTYGGVTVDTVTVTGCAAEGSKGGAIAGYADGMTIKNVNVSDVVSGAALIGHANADAKTIENAKVDAPDAPLIGTTYSKTEGTISITGAGTSIKTKDVIPADSEAGAKTITVSGGTFNIDVTDYRKDGKLVKVETVNGSTQYTIVEDGTDVPAGTYTTAPQDPADDHVVRKDGENSYTVLPDNKDNVSEGTYVTEPKQVPGGYEVIENNDGTWTVQKSAPRYYYTGSASSDDSTKKDDGKKAPRTFDPGVGIYALTAVLSVTGMALVGKRKD